MDNLKPVTEHTICKICGQPAHLFGSVDFNKNCEEVNGYSLPLSGIQIYYHKCENCELVFTEAFDNWTKDEFKKHIYNKEYKNIDPNYAYKRPSENTKSIIQITAGARWLRILDYGAGNGQLADMINSTSKLISAESYEPMDSNTQYPALNSFDLVTAFEVFEHTPTPVASVKEMLSFLKESNGSGLLYFSTYLLEEDDRKNTDHGYYSPRNGHVTIYNRKSIKTLFDIFGYSVAHISDNYHIAYKNIPAWFPKSR